MALQRRHRPTCRSARYSDAVEPFVGRDAAQAVWERAAQLQAQPDAPAPRTTAGEHREAASRSSAYSLDVVRDSAREAGISTGFVDRALVEHGLADAGGAVSATVPGREVSARPSASSLVRDVCIDEPSPWTGARPNIDYEQIVDGEMPESDFDWLVETIRRALGDVGVISTVGRSLSWASADAQRKIHISVQVRGGRTTIRVGERLAPLRGSIFGGVVGGFGGGAGGGSIGLVMGTTHMPVLAFAAASVIVSSSYVAARMIYGRTARDRDRTLGALTERLGEEVRASIAERDRNMARSQIGRPAGK